MTRWIPGSDILGPMKAQRPKHFPELAELCLEAITTHGLGHEISLGGGFALLHYLDYRQTHDIDAWWMPSASPQERQQVVAVIEAALRSAGEVTVRSWGDVVSIELLRNARKVFSFQIASRTAQLDEPEPAPWTDILLDGFDDLIASKMNALVERGAPRDFLDIFRVCQEGLVSPAECWHLWRRRQQLAGVSSGAHRARLAVETHLARIIVQRPLAAIADADDRVTAEQARAWYETELLDALVD